MSSPLLPSSNKVNRSSTLLRTVTASPVHPSFSICLGSWRSNQGRAHAKRANENNSSSGKQERQPCSIHSIVRSRALAYLRSNPLGILRNVGQLRCSGNLARTTLQSSSGEVTEAMSTGSSAGAGTGGTPVAAAVARCLGKTHAGQKGFEQCVHQ